MIVTHAGLARGRMLLWGEVPVQEKQRRGRKPRVQPLPFAADIDDLFGALKEALPDLTTRDVHPDTVHVWLPTIAGRPVASSPLIAEPPSGDSEASLAAWITTAVPLSPAQTVDLLGACLDRPTLAPGTIVGSTLAYWAAALRFAASLIAREQFLPDVESEGKAGRALWKPALLGADAQRFNQLARAMPPACRALASEKDPAPERPAAAVLTDFIGLVVDTLVRLANPASPSVARAGKKKAQAFDSLHDQWLHALRAPESELRASPSELSQLTEQVRTWQRPVSLAASAPFRLFFRLEEPPPKEEDPITAHGIWTVRYLLQAQDDPSLLVPVIDAWTPRGQQAAILHRGGFRPREYLLAALGQASSLCPEVDASLKTPSPAGFSLDAAGAHRFLTETASLLEQAGFGVLLPAWWTRKGTRQRLSVKARAKSPAMQGGSGLSLEQLVQFEWEVALGDHTLTLPELEALAKLKVPLVQVRGQWIQVGAEELKAALDFWKKQPTAEVSLGELVRLALGATPALDGLAFGGVTATGWVEEFLQQLEGKVSFTELPPPAGFRGTLRPYQLRGYSWLAFLRRWGLGACLADDMGLGKTIQTLALIEQGRESKVARPILLLCPMSVVGNWKKEAERFVPDLPVLVHHGQKRIRGDTFVKEADKHALVITSYGLLHRDLALFEKVKWGGVILDEAQNIKNPETKQAKAARSLKANYRIALTGTPVENHVGDLWSIWQFLNPGFLGTQAEFRRSFFVPIQFQRDPEATERLKRLTGPFLLRRLKTDKTIIADLPDKLEMKVFCNLTREQTTLYAAVVKELDRALNEADGIKRKGLILGALSKLKQVCNHPAQFLGDGSPIPGRSGKLARLTEMLEEVLEAGERALIFTQFTEMGEIIKTHLQETFGQEVLFLHGGVSRQARDRMVERFQQPSESPTSPRIFLLSLKAGGTGLNLTAANHVFHFDRWWNPAVEDQATDRAFRIGQQRNVQVHKYVCVGTLEEKIDEMIERKKSVAAQVVGTGEAWLTELSNEELRDVFALREEALGE